MAPTMVVKVVVEQHDRRDLAGALRAALAHGDADVGDLQRRDVVHAVTRHGHDLAGALQRLDERELLRRGRARDDVDARERYAAADPAGDLVARSNHRGLTAEPDLARNRRGRER